MLGATYAALAALTFAFNNATVRRGVLTGTVMQAMAVTIPVGAAGFLMLIVVSGEAKTLSSFAPAAVAWLAGQGVLQFVVGRYFNFRANQLVGVNLSAPVVQLQVIVAMLLAVLVLNESFTVLQLMGTIIMLAGSFAAQREPTQIASDSAAIDDDITKSNCAPAFRPHYLPGFICSSCAAIAYGISPLLVRLGFENTNHKSALAGGFIAYSAATMVFAFLITRRAIRRDIHELTRQNAIWFFCSAVFIAASQGLVYASLAVAPVMVVTPILQLSLIFRLFLSSWLSPKHEVLNGGVVIGAVAAIAGSLIISLKTDLVIKLLAVPEAFSQILQFRLAGS